MINTANFEIQGSPRTVMIINTVQNDDDQSEFRSPASSVGGDQNSINQNNIINENEQTQLRQQIDQIKINFTQSERSIEQIEKS